MSKVSDLYQKPGEFERLLQDAESGARTDWDEAFVSDLKARFERFGDNLFLSARQDEQLERIANQ